MRGKVPVCTSLGKGWDLLVILASMHESGHPMKKIKMIRKEIEEIGKMED